MSRLNPSSPSHCRRVKCTYCQLIFHEAWPQRLFMHVKDNCSKIPPHQKSRYIQEVLQMMATTTSDSEDVSLAGSFTGTTTSRSKSVSTPGQQPSSASYFQCIIHDCTIKIHELLLKALIISNIPS
ncbi:hypothetical protein O181_051713 [Austropuccinia psidii MF-1]|uniref:BED-type domain-containing protein n=1 Tax=Austropuccinia psidii MF-1 TaxID=1389203 RepID=A0A9Q3E1D9_9BASI|nr:hypothetical protein [Austropuccinia psidii MF-1]